MIEGEILSAEIPEWLVYPLWITVGLAALWLVLTIFVHLRRKASNLTPVNAPSAKKRATPDFMSVDHKARAAQIGRGESFESELDEREAAEARSATEGGDRANSLKRFAGIATLLFSIFSLGSTVVGVIWQVDRMGSLLGRVDQLGAAILKHPVPVAVCTFVIGYYVVMFFVNKQWKRAGR